MKDFYKSLTALAIELGAQDARMIETDKIVFDDRAYLKCRFGCNRWGRYWTCPPHIAVSTGQFKAAFKNYQKAIIIQSADPHVAQDVTLAIEKEAMLVCGSIFALAMVMCVQCEACSYPEPCRYPQLARPDMDAYGIDIIKTLEPLGFKVVFDRKGTFLQGWYSMVLV
jgi:predicted metal-binding protein